MSSFPLFCSLSALIELGSLDTGYPLLLRAWELYCGAGEHRRLEALCASVLVLLLLFVLVYSESGYQALPL